MRFFDDSAPQPYVRIHADWRCTAVLPSAAPKKQQCHIGNDTPRRPHGQQGLPVRTRQGSRTRPMVVLVAPIGGGHDADDDDDDGPARGLGGICVRALLPPVSAPHPPPPFL